MITYNKLIIRNPQRILTTGESFTMDIYMLLVNTKIYDKLIYFFWLSIVLFLFSLIHYGRKR